METESWESNTRYQSKQNSKTNKKTRTWRNNQGINPRSIQKDVPTVYAPNIGAPRSTVRRSTDTKGGTNINTESGRALSTNLHQWTDTKSTQKHWFSGQSVHCYLYLYLYFYPKVAEYTLFSIAQVTVSRIDHKLGHKSILKVNLRLKSCQSSFPATALRLASD